MQRFVYVMVNMERCVYIPIRVQHENGIVKITDIRTYKKNQNIIEKRNRGMMINDSMVFLSKQQ